MRPLILSGEDPGAQVIVIIIIITIIKRIRPNPAERAIVAHPK